MTKRARDGLDDIVQAALEEDEAKRKSQKRDKTFQGGKDRGLTLEELEEAEGGPVKESRLGKAQRERASRRKAGRGGDRPGEEKNLERFEEKALLDEDDGQKLEPFNMAAEREAGYFDEEGHYVERNEDEDGNQDAWLGSNEAAVMSEALRRRIEARKQQAEDADLMPQMTKQQTADHERVIASILRPRESVLQALKRLRGSQPPRTAKRKHGKPDSGNASQAPDSTSAADAGNMADFERLTESASALMDSGELDVYSMLKEEFVQAADILAPDDGDDMFADADDQPPVSAPAALPEDPSDVAAAAETQAFGLASHRAPLPATVQVASAEAAVDYSTWPVRELRRFLQERGHDVAGTVEKADLVAQVVAAAAAGPEGGSTDAPAGFCFDPNSGYYSNSETGMYWDSSSGGFCDSSTGVWYLLDPGTQQYVEWPQTASITAKTGH